ncbi:MAG TPA: hypothetical protein VGR56_06820 [Nitrososphaerales archaeon]|nr:hypothetical protein [Nitrososphaerales archaeon]
MRASRIVAASFLSSASMFILASLTNFTVETAQPNGLPEIYEPYGWISFISGMAAIWFLAFGATFSLAFFLRRGLDRARRPALGSGLVSSGVFAVLFAIFWSLVNLQDEGPRCLSGCAPSLLQYYQMVYTASAILAVLGLVAAVYGGRLLARREVAYPPDISATA